MSNDTASPPASAQLRSLPQPGGPAGLQALQAMARPTSPLPTGRPLAALQALHGQMGDVFQIKTWRFQPIVLVGTEAARFFFVDQREHLRWRNPDDAIARLLGQGLLVTDGDAHDIPHAVMKPSLGRGALSSYTPAMVAYTDQVSRAWADDSRQNLLDEVRRIALLITFDTLFGVDISPDLERLWQPVLRSLAFIGPGAWLVWPDMPRPGYRRPLGQLDAYLLQIIRQRRRELEGGAARSTMLDALLGAPAMDETDIRDQMLTMIVAGHDTSTSLLAWAFYLLGRHPAWMQRIQDEIDQVLGTAAPDDESVTQLPALNQALQETMRLYPPAHAAMRLSAADLEFRGYRIPAASRLMFSIFLTHRHPRLWEQPEQFLPERWHRDWEQKPVPYSFLPFGSGTRTCVGANFGRLEAKLILARLLQRFQMDLLEPHVHVHMGAALEPRPGVLMRVRRRP